MKVKYKLIIYIYTLEDLKKFQIQNRNVQFTLILFDKYLLD